MHALYIPGLCSRFSTVQLSIVKDTCKVFINYRISAIKHGNYYLFYLCGYYDSRVATNQGWYLQGSEETDWSTMYMYVPLCSKGKVL